MNKILILDLTTMLVDKYVESLPEEYRSDMDITEKEAIYDSLLKNAEGKHIGAVRGLCSTIFEAVEKINPTHIVGVWGTSRNTNIRKEIYHEYKNEESQMDAPLREQFDTAKIFLMPLIKQYTSNSYEAMDLAGSIASDFSDVADVYILARNKNYLQLTDVATVLLKSKYTSSIQTEEMKNAIPTGYYSYDESIVTNEYGFGPESIADYNALVGNKSIGIPGVRGVGPVTAKSLISSYKTIEQIYERLEELGEIEFKNELAERCSTRRLGGLCTGKENAFVSKSLCKIRRNVYNGNDSISQFKNEITIEKAATQLKNVGILSSWISVDLSNLPENTRLVELIEENEYQFDINSDIPECLGGSSMDEVAVSVGNEDITTFFEEDKNECYPIRFVNHVVSNIESFSDADYFEENNYPVDVCGEVTFGLANEEYEEIDNLAEEKDISNITLIESMVINKYKCNHCEEEFSMLGDKAPRFCIECGVPMYIEMDNLETSGCRLEQIRRKSDLERRLVI